MASPGLQIQEKDGACRITLENPPVNVMSLDMMNRISDTLERLSPHVKVVLLAGAGRGFSAGVDVVEHLPPTLESMLDAITRLHELLYALPAVSIAQVHGFAMGGALELAITCDLIYCAEETRLGLPEINLGVFPPIAMVLLTERVGPNAALEWILAGESFTAETALDAGLINGIYPPGRLQAEVDKVAERLLSLSGATLRIAKRHTYRMSPSEFNDRLDGVLSSYRCELMKTHDAQEGLRAFIEKRSPRFENR